MTSKQVPSSYKPEAQAKVQRECPWLALQACGLMALLLLSATPARSQEQDRRPVVPFEGTQAFQHILQSFNLEPIRELKFLKDFPPKETVVIMFGQLDALTPLGRQGWRLRPFLEEGGAVLVATDHPDRFMLVDLGVSVQDTTVVSPNKGFRGESRCPLLTPEHLNTGHPIFKNIVQGVATNRPSYLRIAGPPSEPQAWFLPQRERLTRQAMVFGAATPASDARRLIVLAGHGIFMNGMLAQTDVDNLLFAANCMSWLTDAGTGRKRKYALFVEDGTVHANFDIPLAQLPPLPIPPTRVINQIIRGVEEEGIINSVLHENVSRDQILHGAMLLLSIGLILVARRSLLRSRYRLDMKVPLIAPSLEKALNDVPVLGQRHRALLLQGNLREAAQMLAQLWFEQRLPPEKLTGDEHPALQISAGWWQRRSLERDLRRLWNLASENDTAAVSRSQFQKLMANVERLSAAHHQGMLRFQ